MTSPSRPRGLARLSRLVEVQVGALGPGRVSCARRPPRSPERLVVRGHQVASPGVPPKERFIVPYRLCSACQRRLSAGNAWTKSALEDCCIAIVRKDHMPS
jgi:hypothetical protein